MVNTVVAPYFDDYNEEKNFHQILFKPGRAVQVRELNQLHSILQNQIERFGNHVFENGSMVIPGEFNFNLSYDYITVSGMSYADIVEILLTNTVSIVQEGTTKTATIVQHFADTLTDPITFYVQYVDADDGEPGFDTGQPITLFNTIGSSFATGVVTGNGKGSVFDIAAGIFFINGNFVRTESQRIVLSKYSTEPSVVVGFRLVESVVTHTNDNTLLDNANGSPNFNAIGADRLKKVLTLEVQELNTPFNREDFIELAAFENGALKRKARGPDYSVLEETLARRTYDESGDYTVAAFGLRVREHLDINDNDGLYPDGDEDKFVVGVEPGKAYVKGFEVESLTTQYLDNDKARDTATENNLGLVTPVGNYIFVKDESKTLLNNTQDLINFHRLSATTPGVSPGGEIVGTARIRYAQRAVVNSIVGTIIYLFDLRSNQIGFEGEPDSRFIGLTASLHCPSQSWTSDIAADGILEPFYSSGLFKLPVSNGKTISDISFAVRRSFSGVTDGTGSITLTAGTNEVFSLPTANVFYADVDGGAPIDISTIATLSGTPVGKSLIINFGAPEASKPVRVYAEVVKQSAQLKTKVDSVLSVSRTPGQFSNRRVSLGKADVYQIDSVIENGVDKTSSYTLVTNATSDVYRVSYLQLKTGESVPVNNITVTGKYLAHGAGDYFSAESYQIPYENIPTIRLNNVDSSLSAFIDFRPRLDDTDTNITGTGSSLTEMPSAYGRLTFDLEYYLPRIDKVYVSSRGDFGVIKGVPALIPNEPPTPDNSMAIYRLLVPAYTKSVQDIQLEFINNRRYTMRDIGKLEDRISKLEYYTTLSLLESETESLQILDNDGFNRFKNGFIVDNFVDHSVGEFTLGEYRCSVSSEDATLRPEFVSEFADFEFDASNSSNVMRTGSLITLPYTQQVYASQLQASGTMNVNPYAVYNWVGSMNLTPSSDSWFDTRYTNPDVTYKVFNNGNLSQQWNSWSVNWTGNTAVSQSVVAGNNITSTIRTTTTTNIAVVNDREVNRTVIPYMRSKLVRFDAQGLLPKSRVYPFFDNVNVGAYCKPIGGSYGQALITNEDGELSGEFLIPNSGNVKFRTGSKQFTLIDNPSNNRVTSISTADSEYTAAGVLVTRTQSIVATRQINQQITVTQNRVTFRDPLAQSFLVDKKGGVFLTSVDLFFASKDKSVPVTLEIRNMVNGYPGQTVLPYSTVTLKPSLVNVSSNGALATTFTFSSTVYLSDGQEYCFVVLSNCNNYNAFIATMGQQVIGSTAYISKQPFVGVMFKSQNSSTWTAEQTSDMKFSIKIANFNTSVIGQAKFKNSAIEKVLLGLNPISSTSGSNTLMVNIPNHGLVAGSKFSLSGAIGANGIPTIQLNATHVVTEVVDNNFVKFTVSASASFTGLFGGDSIMSDKNIQICTIQALAQQLLFENTDLNWTYRGVTSRSINGSETPYLTSSEFAVPVNENLSLLSPLMVCSQTDEVGRSFVDSGVLTGLMSSFSSNISPVIDLERIGVIGISNNINSPSTLNESVNGQGNASARYITKVFGLVTQAKFLRVYADLALPEGSQVRLFCRTGNSEAEVQVGVWSEISSVGAQSVSNEFVEYTYENERPEEFGFYQFKIVMLSTSACSVPRVRRFRGISLGL